MKLSLSLAEPFESHRLRHVGEGKWSSKLTRTSHCYPPETGVKWEERLERCSGRVQAEDLAIDAGVQLIPCSCWVGLPCSGFRIQAMTAPRHYVDRGSTCRLASTCAWIRERARVVYR